MVQPAVPACPNDEGLDLKALAEQIGDIDGVEIYGRVVGVRGLMVEISGPIYAMSVGSYAEKAVVSAWKLVPVPRPIPTRTAAALMLQGMTAHYLVASVYPLKKGDTALVHAAAGGVGGLLVQMAKARGARVFGTASGSKLGIAREAGADEVIDYTTADFEAEVNQALREVRDLVRR